MVFWEWKLGIKQLIVKFINSYRLSLNILVSLRFTKRPNKLFPFIFPAAARFPSRGLINS